MTQDFELSIANLSFLSDENSFLLQTSIKNSELDNFIKNSIPKDEKEWIKDLGSWEINIKWIYKIANICIKSFDQVFFDKGDEILLDLKDDKSYKKFKKIVEESNY